MRYLQKEEYAGLRRRYAVIIGWGAGAEFQKYYEHNILGFEHMIDGAGKNVGKAINGITIESVEIVAQYKEADSVLVVIYPNIENEILTQISEVLPKADTIVARLLDIEGRKTSYSANNEDAIMLDYISARHTDFSYIDIGVCHPIVRNNTYLFYEKGFSNGVLVEPNIEMCRLAAEYRPLNKVVNMGAAPEPTKDDLTYYYDPLQPGLNTFCHDVAIHRGMERNFRKVPMKDINTIIADNFAAYPNVLDLDTEGMDYGLLAHLNFEKYPIDVICVENASGGRISKLLFEKVYRLLDTTEENEIYVYG